MSKSLAFLASLVSIFWTGASVIQAHELWIEPIETHIAAGDEVVADLRIGDMFVGSSLIHLPGQTDRLAILTRDGMQPLSPRAGTRPVITTEVASGGHAILVYQSTDSYVRYQEGEKFFGFADKKGAGWIRGDHAARGLPASDFVERYSRHAKASVFIGDSWQTLDRQLGMEVEFTILSMTRLQSRTQLEILLTFQGSPIADAALTLFTRPADGTVSTSSHRTGANGTVSLLAMAGEDYLLDHVTLRQIDPATDKNGAVWESLWASLTFSGPQR